MFRVCEDVEEADLVELLGTCLVIVLSERRSYRGWIGWFIREKQYGWIDLERCDGAVDLSLGMAVFPLQAVR